MSASGNFELPVPLDQLIQTTTVSVVQQIDAQALSTTLQWIVDRLNQQQASNPDAETASSASDIPQQLNGLQARQAELEGRLSGLEASAHDKGSPTDAASGLEDRVKALEDALASMPRGPSATAGDSSSTTQPLAETAAAGSPSDLADRVAALEQATRDQEAKVASLAAGTSGSGSAPVPLAEANGGAGPDTGALQSQLDSLKDAVEQLQRQRGSGQGADGLDGQPQAESGAAPLPTAVDLSEVEGRLLQLEAAAPVTRQLQEAVADLSSRLAALELRLELTGGAETAASQADDAAAGHAAVASASSLEDALNLVKDLYDKVSTKADRAALDPLLRRLSDLTLALDAISSRLDGLPSQPAAASVGDDGACTAREVASPGGAGEDAALGRVFDLETCISDLTAALKQLQDAVTDIQGSIQQQQQDLAGVSTALAGKADHAAVDRVAAVAAAAAMGGAGADQGALTTMLNDMLADKATKSELSLVQGQLADKVSKVELQPIAALAQQAASQAASALETDGRGGGEDCDSQRTAAPEASTASAAETASKEQLEQLAQQVGDMFAELAQLRSQLASQATQLLSQPRPSTSQRGGPDAGAFAAGADQTAAALSSAVRDLAGLRDALDWVAHAACIMAVGLEPPRLIPAGAGGTSAGMAGGGANNGPPPGLVGGKEPRTQRGAVDRLMKLLGRQSVNHKMDWFDPDTLNQLSQKLGTVEALMHNPALIMGRGVAMGQSPQDSAQLKELEAQLRRLSRDVRALRDRQGDGGHGGTRTADSDHAMLSGKPLMGFRCMACDRPLEKLHEYRGPHIPTHQMPIRLPTVPAEAATKAAIMRAPVVGTGAVTPEASTASVGGAKFVKKTAYDPSQRGPQNWYEDQKGLPADALPAGDVGPKLPPGGWRGSVTGAKPPGSLPELPGSALGKRAPPAAAPSPPATAKPGSPSQLEDHAQMQMNMLPSM